MNNNQNARTSKNILTPEGYEQLKEKLKQLSAKRQEIIEEIDEIRKTGESDDGTFSNQLKDQLVILDSQIQEIERILENAKVVRISNNGKVDIGSKIRVRVKESEKLIEIVGEGEADPLRGKVSHLSPLGQALIGKKPGDSIEIETPAGKIIYEIVSIEA